MAEFSVIEKNGHIRHTFTLKPGDRIKICRCYASKTFPFCDGAHNTLPNNLGPAVVEVPTEPEESEKNEK